MRYGVLAILWTPFACQPLSSDVIRDLPKETEDVCEETCGLNASCDSGDCVCDQGFYGDPLKACEEVSSHLDWIGSPCENDEACPFEDGFCLTEEEGFPAGHCSLWCEEFCPDEDGTPVTFCIEPTTHSGGHCFSRCDVDFYPLTEGCRPEYTCEPWLRVGTTVEALTCVPTAWTQAAEDSD